jgi:hypothetical protein
MACPTVPKKLQLRRDTAAVWTLANPILAEGEIGIETDTNSVKIGNGIAHWNDLVYFNGGSGGSATSGIVDGGDPSSTYVGDPVIDFGGVV